MASSPWVMLPLQQALEEQQLNLPGNRREVVVDALEKLEFRKSFLIFNYIGSRNVEDVVSADQILSYQKLSMTEFEDKIWNDFGKNNCQEKDRVINVNWESGERYNYHCDVDVEGNVRFKGPYLEKAATLLQKTLGDDNVLKVKLMEQQSENMEKESIMQSPVFNQISQGIFLGKKCYQFFVFKDKHPRSNLVECYFVCMEGFSSPMRDPPQTVQDARASFMHIQNSNNLRNYYVDENGEIMYGKDDKPLILTKGTGFISEDLALKCPCIPSNEENLQDMHDSLKASQFPDKISFSVNPPLLIQFHMFYHGKATKGTLLVNKKVEVPDLAKRYPHFMEKGEHRTYRSKSILGEIYDIVDKLSAPIRFWKPKCFEADIPDMYIMLWKNHYDIYRPEMKRAINESKNTNFVYQKYRKELYGGVDDTYDLDTTEKPWKEIRLEALAIYRVCYDYAIENNDPRKCGFAWKVAGDALWRIYLKSTGEKPIMFAPSILRQMMR